MASPPNFLATERIGGALKYIPDCWIQVPKDVSTITGVGESEKGRIVFYALPEVSESKSASYADQNIQGAAAPVKTYANSSNRTFDIILHLYVTNPSDIEYNRQVIRTISALVHPGYNNTYSPPPVCRLRLSNLLSEDPLGVPAVMKSYSVSYPTEVQWFYDETTNSLIPLHVSINTSWDAVYSWITLPGYSDVIRGNY